VSQLGSEVITRDVPELFNQKLLSINTIEIKEEWVNPGSDMQNMFIQTYIEIFINKISFSLIWVDFLKIDTLFFQKKK